MTKSLEEVASPCIRDCCLDDLDICRGCGRSLNEITHWSTSSHAEQLVIVARAAERKHRASLGLPPD